MIPIVLDPGRLRLAMVGRGPVAVNRLRGLLEGGAQHLTVFSDDPGDSLAAMAGDRLVLAVPDAEWLRSFDVVWVADMDPWTSNTIARAARAVGTLVNVEDERSNCDFHTPSLVRRGDLLLTVSTGGRSPGLAVRIRRYLERVFGPEWAGRLDDVAKKRTIWRRRGLPLSEMARKTDELVASRRWLS